MYIPITIAALLLMTGAVLLIRIFWTRIHPRLRTFLIRGSIVVILIQAFVQVTKWGTSVDEVDVMICWLAVAGYELLIMLLSRLSPRWLTSLCAFVLIVPLFTSSILFPLALLFQSGVAARVPIGHHFFYRAVEWGGTGTADSGADLDIFYSPSFAPFLSHRVQSQRFSSGTCNAHAAYVLLGPAPHTVIARCPHWPNEPAGADDKLLKVP